jgi:hypothetical protein
MNVLDWIMPIVMMLWGILVKRWSFLERLPNQLIWLCNLIIGYATKLLTPAEAHAAGFGGTIGHALGWAWPTIQVVLARLLYETFIRPSEELAGVGIPPPTEVKKKK